MGLLHVLALSAAILPVHGTVLGAGPHGTTIVRSDPVTNTLPSMTRAYRLEPRLPVKPGIGIDGFLDRSRSPWRWYDAAIAARFAPGLPDPGKVNAIDYGSPVPGTELVDQNGRPVNLARSFPGKVQLVSFVFTRCPDKDECPLVSSKFAYLQKHLDSRKFHLVLVSLDPVYDSPAVLRRYGRQFGADARSWSLVTGQPAQIAHLLDRFGISSMRVSDANFIHNDKVFLVDQRGVIADVVDTVAWSPDTMIAQARHTAGMVSNPIGRLQLSLIASVVALCGGSQYAGVVLLETMLFLVIAACSFVLLWFVGRKLWKGSDLPEAKG